MFISYNWLKNYLPQLEKIDPSELAKRLSKSIAEVEKIEEKGKGLSQIIVGEIKSVEKHPKNEKLAIAKVSIGKGEPIQVVFASANEKYVKQGMLYPLCLAEGFAYDPKSNLANPQTVKVERKELDGILSEGMLCSARELGLWDDNSGISIISSDLSVGADLTPLLHDYILEIENKSLTHRPDCFSHRGIAREISAIFNIDFQDYNHTADLVGEKNLNIEVKVETDLCKRFTGVCIQNIHLQASPTWMQIMLAYTGMRPINVLVDISNYVMLDIGTPNHIYDYDKIEGQTLIVRKAHKNEKILALNGKEYKLTPDMIVIVDSKNAQDIASIMGGALSEISESTNKVFVEVANFDMFNIRKTSKTLGLVSEASVRSSKGQDPYTIKEALLRIASLISDLTGAEIASSVVDINLLPDKTKTIHFDLKSITRQTGIKIEKDEIIAILSRLGIEVSDTTGLPAQINDIQSAEVSLTIPSFRSDLNITQDIVEEVARIYGYEKIDPKLPDRSIQPSPINQDTILMRKLRKLLLESGLDEVYTYSFIDPKLYSKCSLETNNLVKIINPLSPELSLFRDQLIPSLLEKIELNLPNFEQFAYFEINTVAIRQKKELPNQPRQIAGVFVFSQKVKADLSYYTAKAKLDFIFSRLGINLRHSNIREGNIANSITNIFHPNKASILKSIDGSYLGFFGFIHPRLSLAFKYENLNILAFSIDYNAIKNKFNNEDFTYSPFSNLQSVARDISLWLNEKTEIGPTIEGIIKNVTLDYPARFELLDTFISEKGARAATIRIILENSSPNLLTDKDINAQITKIEDYIQSTLQLKLR